MSSRAAGVDTRIQARLRAEFPHHTVLRFAAVRRLRSLVTPNATVVVAGGDGTVGAVVRVLAGTRCRIGIVPLGTFNNFASALQVPAEIDTAIDVVHAGRARAVTLGRVNGVVFLEACAVGLFGEAIRLGEFAKDRKLRGISTKVKRVLAAQPFQYRLAQDLVGSGSAMSLVFSNTYSTGIRLPVGESSPADRYLEFSVHAGSTHLDIAGRALASALLAKHREDGAGQVLRFRKLRVTTKPRVRAYADHVPAGYTPLTVTAELSKLKFIVPG
ncbi:MAG TPA: diacylglycerol kinase family protein [Candidatus Dormibacteraeota bacterium]|nr:diacylglycerol kinase family protein [Candidatus Dormibacteraeota bacterium]